MESCAAIVLAERMEGGDSSVASPGGSWALGVQIKRQSPIVSGKNGTTIRKRHRIQNLGASLGIMS